MNQQLALKLARRLKGERFLIDNILEQLDLSEGAVLDEDDLLYIQSQLKALNTSRKENARLYKHIALKMVTVDAGEKEVIKSMFL